MTTAMPYIFTICTGKKFDLLLQGAELAGDRAGDARLAGHQRQIREAEGIVLIHPNWWGRPPAMLKAG